MIGINDTIDLRPYYKTLTDCKEYLNSLQKSNKEPSKNSIKQYLLDMERMDKNKDTPLTLCTSKNTYYKYRAAWSYSYREMSKELITNINNAQKNNNKSSVVFLIKQLELVIENIKKFPPDFEGNNLKLSTQGKYNSDWQQVKNNAPKSKSKKYQKLPEKWNERYFKYVIDSKSKYIDAIALLEISGCRPSELENSGISIELEKDGSIRIVIESKKTHDGKYGQEYRIFNVKTDSLQFNYLKEKLVKNPYGFFIFIHSAKNLGNQMSKFSDKVFPRMKTPISPYTYRHHFAMNVKTALNDDFDAIAIAMGHSNDKSQTYYARSSKSSGKFSIENIEGSRDVKHVVKHFSENTMNTKNQKNLSH